jgi:hypothetical protein
MEGRYMIYRGDEGYNNEVPGKATDVHIPRKCFSGISFRYVSLKCS